MATTNLNIRTDFIALVHILSYLRNNLKIGS